MPLPLVLVHGLRGSSLEWDPLRALFEKRGHPVSTPQLPGHGSRRDEPFSVGESLVTIAEAVRDAGGSAVLIGHGLGAHLAIACASEVRHTSGAIAIGCGTQPLGWILDSYRIASASHPMLPDDGAAMSAAASSTFVRPGESTPVATSDHFADTLRQLEALDTIGALGRLDVPVWLLNGRFDLFRLQERAFLRAAASASLVRQPGVRLARRISRPAETARLLETIVDSLEKRR